MSTPKLPAELYVEVEITADRETHVGTNVDPWLSAKVLVEGLGALIPAVVEWSASKPNDLKPTAHNMSKEEVLSRLHALLEDAANDYETKREILSPWQIS